MQSEIWRDFQKEVGNFTDKVKRRNFFAGVIGYKLPPVGNYLYVPRGPLMSDECAGSVVKRGMRELIFLAQKRKSGWIRIEPTNEKKLKIIKKNIDFQTVKAPHDMQPRQIFVLDISKEEDVLQREMKAKTRYNIRLAEKKGVVCRSYDSGSKNFQEKMDKFLDLVEMTAKRKGVKFHRRQYYKQMAKMVPQENFKLYSAEYRGEVLTSNLIIFYGKVATYLHGASADKYKNVMAPFLLQWKIIGDAKKMGFSHYDLGGVKVVKTKSGKYEIASGNWQGISRFKLGFSQTAVPIEFPGSYDIILNKRKYLMYRLLQKFRKISKI